MTIVQNLVSRIISIPEMDVPRLFDLREYDARGTQRRGKAKTGMNPTLTHMGSHACITYAHILQLATMNDRSRCVATGEIECLQ